MAPCTSLIAPRALVSTLSRAAAATNGVQFTLIFDSKRYSRHNQGFHLLRSNVRHYSNVRLAEVGKLESPRSDANYSVGQIFLHRVFGYRGVILFPWLAKVYDRDLAANKAKEKTDQDHEPTAFSHIGREVKSKTHHYYQVLIDSRDCPYIRAQTEAVTFLGNQENSRSLYAIPGLDYVAHEDIIPYSSTEKNPLHHELFTNTIN